MWRRSSPRQDSSRTLDLRDAPGHSRCETQGGEKLKATPSSTTVALHPNGTDDTQRVDRSPSNLDSG